MHLISFKDVSKKFGENIVLRRITFNVEEGECLALLGRSGGGKSTLLKILLGLYSADGGTITYRGKEISHDGLRKVTGYTSQENSFYDNLTVTENIRYYAARNRVRLSKAAVRELVASVRLEAATDTLAGQLSGGMKRRLDFALSMVHDPPLLVLDEPTAGLDPVLVDEFWATVDGMRKKGKTLIVITHHLEDVKKHADRAVILKEGKVGKVLDDVKDIMTVFRRFS